LRIADFADLDQLVQGPPGYYRAPVTLRETAHSATVQQGYLEGSNVSPIEEMVSMITLQSSF
jgi:flagellar basal body rod protein FlgG